MHKNICSSDSSHEPRGQNFERLLTLGVHAQEGYCSWVCVCVCVCLSVKSHLTSGTSVRPENTVTYSAGNRGQNICGVFFKTAPFKSYGVKRKQKSQYTN